MSFLDRIYEANRHDLSHFRPLSVNGREVGFIRHDFADTLRRWPQVFHIAVDKVTLAPHLATVQARTAAVHEVVLALRDEGALDHYWWDENYAASRYYGEAPGFLIERAAIQPFGVCGYGVHLNGFVRDGGTLKMWIGRRARFKASGAGKLDQIVAGGQPANIGLIDNMLKECAEEAAIPRSIARRLRPAGAISYCLETHKGLRPDVIFVFDLEMPADFTPVNADGEVEEFYLWDIQEVIETVRDSTAFKFNCALVIIDFLVRHGLIAPDDPDYLAMVSGLRYREIAFAQAKR